MKNSFKSITILFALLMAISVSAFSLTRSSPSTSKAKHHLNRKCWSCNGSGSCSSCSGQGKKDCGSCGGSGQITPQYGDHTPVTCKSCNGKGQVRCSRCNGSGSCSTCHGTGQLD